MEVWNQWREENKKVLPDLSGADLTEAKLSNINLIETNLGQAVITPAEKMLFDINIKQQQGVLSTLKVLIIVDNFTTLVQRDFL